MKNLVKILIALGLLVIIGAVSAFLLFNYITRDIPEVSSLRNYNPPTVTRFKARNGEVLLELAKEKRILKEINEMPRVMIDAVVSAEDSTFFEHAGIDYVGWVRAILKVIKAKGKFVQGASTLTMQVAKTFLLTSEKKIIRKLKEMVLAKQIEEKFSKEEILYLYLNQVYFGSGYHGVGAAAKGYFGKAVEDISIAEAALIAGLLPAPGRYSPFLNPKAAKNRQRYVLKRMLADEKISQAEYEKALKEKIMLHLKKSKNTVGGYYTDYLRWKLIDELGEKAFMSSGFNIKTYMDYELQKVAEKAALEGAKQVDKMQGYAGPLKKIAEDKVEEELLKIKESIFKEEAPLVALNPDGTTSYQYIDEIITDEGEDRLKKFLRVGANYKAIVTEIDQKNQIAFISIGGVKGFIEYTGFNWAKTRVLSSKVGNSYDIKDPSKVFSVGDLIYIKIEKKDVSIWGFLTRKQREKYKPFDADRVKGEKLILASLDQKPAVQVALMAMSAETGEVYSFVGGTDFRRSQFNRAVQAKRQPGSAFKPLIFARALESGFTPATIIMDTPHALAGFDVSLSWKPKNSDGRFLGPITFRRSLEKSRNIPAIKILQEVGVSNVINFGRRIGLQTKFPEDLGISLGSFGMSLKELTEAYTIFPSGGKKLESSFIEGVSDERGEDYTFSWDKGSQFSIDQEDVLVGDFEVTNDNVIESFKEKLSSKQVYDPRLAYIMTSLLRGVVQNGTAKRARDLGKQIGGKTGTTNSNVDAWFIGFSPKFVVGVWVGMDDNKEMGYGAGGGAVALPIWRDYMKAALDKYGVGNFKTPSGIVEVRVNRKTGELASAGDPDSYNEIFVYGTEPGGSIEEKNEGTVEDVIIEDNDFFQD